MGLAAQVITQRREEAARIRVWLEVVESWEAQDLADAWEATQKGK